jgi:hypothetical protein
MGTWSSECWSGNLCRVRIWIWKCGKLLQQPFQALFVVYLCNLSWRVAADHTCSQWKCISQLSPWCCVTNLPHMLFFLWICGLGAPWVWCG